MLLRSTDAAPDAPAIVDGAATVTYAELEALAAATAGSLVADRKSTRLNSSH